MKLEQEQLIRKVTKIGNGAHIFVPKEWLGEEVIIARPIKKLNEKILSILWSYLGDIRGVYLYGSHARGEAEEKSDIDLFIISDKKLKIKSKGYEIICLEEKNIKKAIKISPLLVYSVLSEAKPIMNSSLLELLRKKHRPSKASFLSYIKETENMINIDKELIEKKQNLAGVSYSLLLRLKGIYLINCLLFKKKYSNKDFLSWLELKVPKSSLEKAIVAYKAIKRDEKISGKLGLDSADLKEILLLLEKEIKKW